MVVMMGCSCCCYGQSKKQVWFPGTADLNHVAIDTFIPRKRFWRASWQLMAVQVIPWSYNYFVRDAEFAKISWQSIAHNLKLSSWEWDDNNFKTNQFAHPYHGSMYYSSFRSNGYNFWQSAPAAIAGSLMWEIAGETHPPAPNDLINTSLGGISLGEMTYRLSNSIVNNKQRGFMRQTQEVFGFLVNPLNGFNRILDGRWGKVHVGPVDTSRIPLSGVLDIGGRKFGEQVKDVLTKGENEFYIRARLQYGNHYESSKVPFHNFSVNVEAGAGDSVYLNALQVNAAISQWIMKETSSNTHHYSITMNYDYLNNLSFEYGAQSFNFSILSQWKKQRKTKFFSNAGVGVIVLAAVPDDYLYYGEGRNYDYGPGFSISAGGGINVNDKFTASLYYRGGWFVTVNGNESSFFLNCLSTDMRYQFSRRLSLAIELGHYSLNGDYKNYDDVSKRYPYVKYSLGYKFGG
jgi:hypothetical protein